jgi:peroxiredoxin
MFRKREEDFEAADAALVGIGTGTFNATRRTTSRDTRQFLFLLNPRQSGTPVIISRYSETKTVIAPARTAGHPAPMSRR